MLRGEKVVLRAVERDDLKRLHELERNVDLVLLGDGNWQPVPFDAFVKNFEKNLERDEKSFFVIEVDGVVIGTMGLHHSNRREAVTEFGIGIYDPAYLGKGHGRDAIQVLLRWAFRVQNYRRVWLSTTGTNTRAIRAYEACGFIHEGRLREHVFDNGQYVDMVHMGMLRSEWEARQG